MLDAITLVQTLMDSEEGKSVLERLASDGNNQADETRAALTSAGGLTDLLMSQGDRAWAIVKQVAGAAAHFVIGLLDHRQRDVRGARRGPRAGTRGSSDHAPVPASTVARFAAAFVETGRGLAFGSSAPACCSRSSRPSRTS